MIKELNKYKNFIFAAHDYGAGKQIIHLANQVEGKKHFLFQGPSKVLIKHETELSQIELKNSVNSKLENCFIIGTGWQTDFELFVMDFAHKNQVDFYVVIDHWYNIKDRFKSKKFLVNPTNIIVFDEFIKEMCAKYLPKSTIIKLDNYLLNDLKNELDIIQNRKKNSLLFIDEPFRNNEKIIYDKLLSNINLLASRFNCDRIIFREHPSGATNLAIKSFLSTNINKFEFTFSNSSLSDDLKISKVILGNSSYALFLADKLGFPCFSLSILISGEKKFPDNCNIEYLT